MSAQYNIRLLVAYDGTHFLGWQKTKEGISVEETLETTLSLILQEPIALQAASRTDRGVHAEGQVINFYCSSLKIPLQKVLISLNQLLDDAIVVREIAFSPLDFHPTLLCKGKTYHYNVDYDKVQLPQHRLYSWHVPYALNLDSMQIAKDYLIGTHNFKALCNDIQNRDYRDYIRTIQAIEILNLPEKRLQFAITGDNFLYKMVRNTVGSLIDVGRGKLDPYLFPQLLKKELRSNFGVTAPAHGLFLHQVHY